MADLSLILIGVGIGAPLGALALLLWAMRRP